MKLNWELVRYSAFGGLLATISALVITAGVMLLFALQPDGYWTGLKLTTIITPLVSTPFFALEFHRREKIRSLLNQIQKMNEHLEVKATTDALTGLTNRGHFMSQMETRLRSPNPGYLFYVDIDRFKTINDNYGHQTGDEAITLIAKTIAQSFRPSDLIGRIGGEEFAVLCDCTSERDAHFLSERLRRNVESLRFVPRGGKTHPLSISVGVSRCLPSQSISDIFGEADSALYQAKDSGRNRVVHFPVANDDTSSGLDDKAHKLSA